MRMVSAVCPDYSLMWRALRKKYAGSGSLVLVSETQLEPAQEPHRELRSTTRDGVGDIPERRKG
jgi:hypothetical protein